MAVSKRFIKVGRKTANTPTPVPTEVQVSKGRREYGFEAMAAEKAIRRAKNIDEFVELVTHKPVRKKHPGRLYKEQVVAATGRPYLTDYGMVNPIKLNISDATLAKLKHQK